MVYEWKVNGIFKTDANVAGKVCENLRNSCGLTKETLVEASRPEDAPLHREFEWNDAIAAEEYRKEQAGKIIRLLSVKMEENNSEPVRAFFTLDKSPKQKAEYHSINLIMQEPQKRVKLLDIALMELKAFQNKYSMLTELSEVFEAIERIAK